MSGVRHLQKFAGHALGLRTSGEYGKVAMNDTYGEEATISTTVKRPAARLFLGLIVLLLVGYGIRSIMLPAQSAAVFVTYAEGSSRQPAPASPLFQNGQLEFAGFEPIQLAGQNLGAWDEVVIVNFDRAADYQEFVTKIAAEDSVARYHLMKIAPKAPELLYFTNWRLRSFRNGESIDPGERVPIEDVVPDTAYIKQWRNLFDGAYRDGIVMLNLLLHEEDPQDPTGGPDSGASSEELYGRYSQKATRVLGKLGGQILGLGAVDRVVVGPQIRNYDVYAFVFYPSVDVFEIMFTARERVEAQIYQRAGLNADGSAGYWVKPYPEFTPVAK